MLLHSPPTPLGPRSGRHPRLLPLLRPVTRTKPEAKPEPKPQGKAMAIECVKTEGPFIFGERYYCTGRYPHTQPHIYLRVMLEAGVERTVSEAIFKPCNPRNWQLFSPGHQLRWNKALGRVRTTETAA